MKQLGGIMVHQYLTAGSLILVASVAFADSAFAVQLSLQPRVSIGSQYYEYDAGENSDVNSKVTYAFGGIGLTGQIGKFFIDLYGQTNLNEGEDDINNFEGSTSDRETTVNRKEVNVTAGFIFNRYVTAFGGLKYAKSNIDTEFSDDLILTSDVSIDLETDYVGPFGGLAVTFPIADVGAISVNGSVAYLDGEETVENSNLVDPVVNDGNSLGFALGIGWSGRIGPSTSGFGYGAGIDYSAYDFDVDGEDEFEEKTLRIRGDLKYRF